MKRILLRIAVVAFLPLVLACQKSTTSPEKPRPVRTVTVAPADGRETLTQTGDIQPRRQTDLSFQIDGRLARRMVEVGSVVTKGQALAVLDDGLVQNEVRASEADLTSATSALELAKSSLARQEQLFVGQSVSQQQIDEARASVRTASARRDVAAAASLNAKKKLGYTQLFAPEAGIVTAVGANQGQVVNPGQMVARLATLERDAVFDVAERIIANAPADAEVRVHLVSNPDVSAIGTVREVSPQADPTTRTYRVRIDLPSPPRQMSLGAAVIGKVELPEERLVSLPASAITSEANAPAVYVVDLATKKLVRRAVRVSRFTGERALVASGLEAGDVVVTAGVSKLRPEQTVALADLDGGAR
ncbi:efflux RND transporter periplasmic adaptor subunit [Pendulispora albinea]|uniref:Efflux RND transporter periplasmic adaptor subunit n=1 Tax=Pendulispora albinea TaxID=2741071 RepID=A0ABZ2LWL0_9BACT